MSATTATLDLFDVESFNDFLFGGTNTEVQPTQTEQRALTPHEENIGSDTVFSSLLLLERLESLLSEEEEDAYGRLRPTTKAYRNTIHLLRKTEAAYGGPLPTGSVSTDSEGGIRITWSRLDQELQMICPADSDEAHLYYEQGEEFWVRHGLDSRVLAEHLRLCE